METRTRTDGDDGVGALLRDWRMRRRLSQLDLAGEAEVSARHLSFVETGRARPSRELILRLAESLEAPLRERNRMLLAAGYAPVYPQRGLDDPAMREARETVARLLDAHAPWPALAVDRGWTLQLANRPLLRMVGEVADPALLAPPVNVLRLSLHPDGLAPRIANLAAWKAHVLARLRREADLTGDPALTSLERELAALPAPPRGPSDPRPGAPAPAVATLRLRVGDATLSLLTATTVLGGAAEVTLSELTLETFLPADAGTAAALRALDAEG